MKSGEFMRRGKPVSIVRERGRFTAIDEKSRLLSKVMENGRGCWLWTDTPGLDGYGKFQASDGRTERAHRASWRLHRGEIPKGMLCLHKCDNPRCVNPDHLFLGTQRDNIQDMREKGRFGGRARITATTAGEIKRRLLLGERATDIARTLGIPPGIVFSIKHGRAWRDVEPLEPENV